MFTRKQMVYKKIDVLIDMVDMAQHCFFFASRLKVPTNFWKLLIGSTDLIFNLAKSRVADTRGRTLFTQIDLINTHETTRNISH